MCLFKALTKSFANMRFIFAVFRACVCSFAYANGYMRRLKFLDAGVESLGQNSRYALEVCCRTDFSTWHESFNILYDSNAYLPPSSLQLGFGRLWNCRASSMAMSFTRWKGKLELLELKFIDVTVCYYMTILDIFFSCHSVNQLLIANTSQNAGSQIFVSSHHLGLMVSCAQTC